MKKKPKKLSQPEETFALHLKAEKLPIPKREYSFDRSRRWRADFAWPDYMVAVEIQGGTWTQGGHVRGKGYEQDCEKHNAMVEQGWRVFWYTSDMVKNGTAIGQIRQILRAK